MAIAEREVLSAQPTASQPQERLYTVEEYLSLEEATTERSEYVHGRIRLMSGGTDSHGIISVNVTAELRAALRAGDCAVMPSDVKVSAGGQMYYPDASVVCGPRQHYSGSRFVITNLVLVAEVLSPSTESNGRDEKFHNYRAIETLAVYLLVSQDERRVEQFSRTNDGPWQYTQASGLEGILDVPALSISLSLAELYSQIVFSEAADE